MTELQKMAKVELEKLSKIEKVVFCKNKISSGAYSLESAAEWLIKADKDDMFFPSYHLKEARAMLAYSAVEQCTQENSISIAKNEIEKVIGAIA